jgi:hypothetical protein
MLFSLVLCLLILSLLNKLEAIGNSATKDPIEEKNLRTKITKKKTTAPIENVKA